MKDNLFDTNYYYANVPTGTLCGLRIHGLRRTPRLVSSPTVNNLECIHITTPARTFSSYYSAGCEKKNGNTALRFGSLLRWPYI